MLNAGLMMAVDGTAKLTLQGNETAGTFTVKRSSTLDVDGRGGLYLGDGSGAGGSAMAAASVIEWKANDDGGLRQIKVVDRAVVLTAGAKFVIDLSAAPKSAIRGKYCLVSAPMVTGFENLEYEVALPEGVDSACAEVVCEPGKGIYLKTRLGSVLMIK